MEVWESIAISITERDNINFSSRFEASIAATLDLMHISFSYKNMKFPIIYNDKKITFTPDFMINGTFNGKKILIETHGKRFVDERFIEKMHAFMSDPASSEYYTIIITNKMPKKPDKLKIELKKHGYDSDDICNKVWSIHYNQATGLQLSLKNESGSLYTLLDELRSSINENNDLRTRLLRKGRPETTNHAKKILKSTY